MGTIAGLAGWLAWEDTHGGEAIATVWHVDRLPPGPTSGPVVITDDALPTDAPPWRYASTFELPDGTECKTTDSIFPPGRKVVVGDATTVHYSRRHPCENFVRADRYRSISTAEVLAWGFGMEVIGLLVAGGVLGRVRRPARTTTGT
ncbi:hypothetical protein AB0M46_33205 [Dactylosporangium sp. NPDC051485]|uniref:hypothetical protein n=1 Tax=Dactylosporangium sp. NPDC051485 TaxID=3154846 RepID=UPI003429DE87